jgi:NitT/TauT family transport system permease protein
MIHRPISWRWHLLLGVAGILTLLAGYTLVSWVRQSDDPKDKVAPNWWQIWSEGGLAKAVTPYVASTKTTTETVPGPDGPQEIRVTTIVTRVMLWDDLAATGQRLLWGLLISSAISLVLGVLMGCYAAVEAFFLPPLAYLAKIPATALLSILFALCGLYPRYYTVMIGFGLIPTMAQSIYLAAKKDVPEELLFKARTLGASQLECIWSVILPHIWPKILDTIRLNIGPALIFLFAAEYVWGQDDVGIGATIRTYIHKGAAGATLSYAYVVLLGFFGLLIDNGMNFLQRWLCPWYVQEG